MKELLFIGIGLLVLWYLSEPDAVAVVDTVPAASVGVSYAPDGGFTVQAVF